MPPTTPPADGRTRRSVQKKNAVLDAAIALFLENGYAGTTLEMVARAAGVSTATVFKHFPTKAALFGALMARMWENEPGAEPPAPPRGDPRLGLARIGAGYAALLRDPEIVALFRVVIAEVPRLPELGEELYRRGKEPYLLRLHAYLEREREAGTLRVDDVPLAVRQFLGMINDVVFWPRLLVPGVEVTPAEAERVVRGAVDTFLARYGA